METVTDGAQEDGEEHGRVWHPRRRLLTTGLVMIVSLTAFEALAVATALPSAIDDIGGLRFYGWAFSSFMLANLVGIPAAGDASDRSGAQKPFAVGCVLFTIGLIVAGLSTGIVLFIVGRVLQGFGAGAISASAYVAVARAYPNGARPRMLAVLSTAWVIPGVIGPAAAGALTSLFGWRSVFLFLIPLVVAAAALTVPAMRRLAAVENPEDRPSRTGSALQLAAGTGLALVAVEVQPTLLAVVVFAAGVAFAAPAFKRLLPPGVLSARPGLPAAVATLGVMSAMFFGAEAYVPLSLTTVRGQSPLVAGVALTAATLLWTSGTWMQERVESRFSRRALTCVGLLLVIVAVVGVATVLSPSVPISVAPLMWGVAGLGMGIAYPTATLVALESAEPGREGEASAAMQLANVLGTAIGTGLSGGVLALATSAGHSAAFGIALVDALAVAVGVISLAAADRLPRRVQSSPSDLVAVNHES